MAQQIINYMNSTQDEGLIKVLCDALDELNECYIYDTYVGWILTNGIPRRARRKHR